MTSTVYFKRLFKCVSAVAFYYITVTSAAIYDVVAAFVLCERCLTLVRTIRTVVWNGALELLGWTSPGIFLDTRISCELLISLQCL